MNNIMEDIKKSSKLEERNCNLPKITEDILSLFTKRFINHSDKYILNTLISRIAQMITSKRVTLNNSNSIILPNWYCINFAPSGFGKDYLLKTLDEEIFINFKEWHIKQNETYKQREYQKIENKANELFKDTQITQRLKFITEEKSKVRNITLEMQDGTQEGLYADAKTLSKVSFGSIFIKMSELSSYLTSLTPDNKKFINCLNNAYDGKIIAKCIKSDYREQDIEKIPVNILLYSSYSKLHDKKARKTFFEELETGLARRSQIVFIENDKKLKPNFLSSKEKIDFNLEGISLGNKLNCIFEQINYNSCYTLKPSAHDRIFQIYESKNIEKFNNCDNDLLKVEIQSRPFKALKLSCLYACLNHPKETIINDNDLTQAIETIEYLSSEFENLLNFKPKIKDKYDKVFDFFLKNVRQEFTKTELTRKYFSECGFSRRIFEAEFNEIIDIVSDIAKNKNYILCESENLNKTKIYYLVQQTNINGSLKDIL